MKRTGMMGTLLAVVLLVCFFNGCTLTGCSGTDATVLKAEEIQHIAIVVSNTKNEAEFDLSSLEAEIKDAVYAAGTTVTIIEADGNPYLVDTLVIPEYKPGISEAKRKQLAEGYANQILGLLKQCQPKSAEMDLYKGIQMAGRALLDYEEGNKTILIASSGLSTTSFINFTELYLEQDHSEELAEQLKDQVVDLSGVSVYWSGLGETAEPQAELYESNRTILLNTWKTVLMRAGMNEEDIHFSSAPASDPKERADAPHVSVVIIAEPAGIMAENDFAFAEPNEEGEEKTDVFVMNDEKVSFYPNSAELLTDRKIVCELLENMIEYLKEHPEHKTLLAGTTASCGKEDTLKSLSLKRCQTIKSILVQSGVSEGQVLCAGLGYANHLTCIDTDSSGRLIEEEAKKNRAVYIFTNAESDAAKKVISQTEAFMADPDENNMTAKEMEESL